jgi:hypothetical protein
MDKFAQREGETGEEYIKRLDIMIELCDKKLARLNRISKYLDRFVLVISGVYAVLLGYLAYVVLL